MKLKNILLSIAVIAVAGALLLAGSRYSEEKEKTLTQKIAEQMLRGSVELTEQDGQKMYRSADGYAAEMAVQGYADEIRVLVGMDKNGMVTGVVILENRETLGLGSRAQNDTAFLMQFLGTEGNAEVGENIDALSGATVTSRAIAGAINSAVSAVTGADVSSAATSEG